MHRRGALVLLCSILSLGFAPGTAAQNSGYREALARFERAKQRGDFVQGEACLLEALRLDRGDEYAWRSLAWCQMHQGKWRESLEVAEENVRRHGTTAWSLLQLFESQKSAGDWRSAKRTLEFALRLRDRQNLDLGKVYNDFIPQVSRCSYDLEIELLPGGHAEEGRLEFLIPLNCERQRFENRQVVGAEASSFASRDGKEFLQLTARKGDRVVLKGRLTLEPVLIGPRDLDTATAAAGPGVSAYLGKFRHGARHTYDPDLPQLRQAAAIVGRTPAEKTRSILTWLKRDFTTKQLAVDDLPSILTARHGVCHHYCGVFNAAARSQGIPARILHVTVLPDLRAGQVKTINEPGTDTRAHGQNEVWLGSLGWVPVEPQNPNSLGAYRNNVILFDRAGNGPEDNHWQWRSAQGCRMTVRLVETRSVF